MLALVVDRFASLLHVYVRVLPDSIGLLSVVACVRERDIRPDFPTGSGRTVDEPETEFAYQTVVSIGGHTLWILQGHEPAAE